MKRILIVGNWKMNLNTSQASILVHRLQERIKIHRDIEVVLAPNIMVLQPLSVQIDRRKFRLAGQNAYHRDEGAFTGEVSFTMLRDIVHYCIIGHSERRHVFNEDNDMIRDKAAAAWRNEITPILCVGETEHERKNGETKQVIHDQLMTGLSNLTAQEVGDSVIAYEPVWAIGTGAIASPDKIEEVLAYIRSYIKDVFGPKAAKRVRVLYGGSVTHDVISGYMNIPGVDGFLVGGASLNYESFAAIVEAARRWQRNQQEPEDGR